MLTVAEVSEVGELAALATEWGSLVDSSPDGSFFETYEWLASWTEAFWAPRPAAFLFVRDEHTLIGFAPFLRDEDGDAWCRHTLTFPHHSHFPRASVVAAAGARTEVLDALIAHAAAKRGAPPIIFTGVERGSPLWREVGPAAERHGRTSMEWPGPRVPWVRIDGSWDDYLTSRTSHQRAELRRKRRKVEKAGRVEVRLASTRDECDAALCDVMRVEHRSWKHDAGTSFDTEAGVGAFYTALGRRVAERGWLRIYVMYLDGEPIAHIYGVVHKNQFLALKTSYDEGHRDLSPGIVLFEHALRDAFERGHSSFDLLGVESRWKSELATDVREPATTCVFSPTAIRCRGCRAYECSIKPLVKEHAAWLVEVKRRLAKAPG